MGSSDEKIVELKRYIQDKGVVGICYNPFIPSQMKLLQNWFANQCDYFRDLEEQHPTEIYYSGMASAAKMIRDKFILEQFVTSLDKKRWKWNSGKGRMEEDKEGTWINLSE